MTIGALLLFALALYLAAGLVVALAFVTTGVTRALDHPVKVSTGARILFIPAATALWPLILLRWRRAGGAP